MSDPNGSNTTAAAAVLCAQKHIDLAGKTITILAGTGPVGQRIAQIVAGPASRDSSSPPIIRICSRKLVKAESICDELSQKMAGNFVPVQTASGDDALSAIADSQLVFAAGAAGVELLPSAWQQQSRPPEIMVDLNAVPPAGIAGIEVSDSAQQRNGTLCFGAIGVGGLKMKIHKKAIGMLFEANDLDLDVEEIYAIGV